MPYVYDYNLPAFKNLLDTFEIIQPPDSGPCTCSIGRCGCGMRQPSETGTSTSSSPPFSCIHICDNSYCLYEDGQCKTVRLNGDEAYWSMWYSFLPDIEDRDITFVDPTNTT